VAFLSFYSVKSIDDDYFLYCFISMTDKPKVIFVLGGPGSGKGTHCDMLRERYHFVHYSVGDILREYLKSGTKEAAEISKRMKEGQMVSSKPIVESLQKKIKENGSEKIVMIDGFPRNQENMNVWEEIISDAFDVRLLLYIEVQDSVMKSRLLNRGKTSGRLDDNETVIDKRLMTFH